MRLSTCLRFAARVTLASAVSAFGAGCFGNDGPPGTGSSGGFSGEPSGGPVPTQTAGPADGGSSPPSAQPLLVDVDPNRTLTATPGQGVGIFTEYTTGGHWHVWWTCDTSQTSLSCPFQIRITSPSSSIAGAASDASSSTGGQLTTPSPQEIDDTVTTTTGTDGVTFRTAPGATITLDASIGGVRDGAYFFFVQDGTVNGGFKGTLTDPLMLEGSSP